MRYVCGILFASVFLAASANAQMSGRISGSVIDATGAAVGGADVELYLAGGQKPLLVSKTSAEGLYNFIGVRPADYDLAVSAKGFIRSVLHGITVDMARETDVPRIKLELAGVTQSVEVSAEVQGVDVATAEVSTTVSMEQIKNLPILDRDVLSIMQTKAGVVSNGNSTTVINGLRTCYSNMTLDGINIQDNYIRDNALDYTPNRLLLGQVRQMTLITSNRHAAASGGATETAFSTPSGTNQYHGEAFWYNRNNDFSANDWFNNQAGVARPFLNQNQFGGSISAGPSRRTSCSSTPATRPSARTSSCRRISPFSPPDARNGIFTYNSGGVTPQGESAHPQEPDRSGFGHAAHPGAGAHHHQQFGCRRRPQHRRLPLQPARQRTARQRHRQARLQHQPAPRSERDLRAQSRQLRPARRFEQLRACARGHQSDPCRPGGALLALDAVCYA